MIETPENRFGVAADLRGETERGTRVCTASRDPQSGCRCSKIGRFAPTYAERDLLFVDSRIDLEPIDAERGRRGGSRVIEVSGDPEQTRSGRPTPGSHPTACGPRASSTRLQLVIAHVARRRSSWFASSLGRRSVAAPELGRERRHPAPRGSRARRRQEDLVANRQGRVPGWRVWKSRLPGRTSARVSHVDNRRVGHLQRGASAA